MLNLHMVLVCTKTLGASVQTHPTNLDKNAKSNYPSTQRGTINNYKGAQSRKIVLKKYKSNAYINDLPKKSN